MPRKNKDYSTGKIYAIRNSVNDIIYIGSTTQALSRRMACHRGKANAQTERKLYQNMRDIGIDKFYIELLELCPCKSQEQLNKREGELIRAHNSIVNGYNSLIAGRTQSEYRQANKEKIAEEKREYRQANKGKIAEYNLAYRQANKEKIAEQNRAYYKAKIEKMKDT